MLHVVEKNISLMKQFVEFGGKFTIKEAFIYFQNLGI
jgi:hypothetical protein